MAAAKLRRISLLLSAASLVSLCAALFVYYVVGWLPRTQTIGFIYLWLDRHLFDGCLGGCISAFALSVTGIAAHIRSRRLEKPTVMGLIGLAANLIACIIAAILLLFNL